MHPLQREDPGNVGQVQRAIHLLVRVTPLGHRDVEAAYYRLVGLPGCLSRTVMA